MQRACPKCQIIKDEEDFPRSRSTKSGRDYKCKSCHREAWHARKPAPAFEPWRIPPGFTITAETVRELFALGDDALLRWNQEISAVARKGSIAGDRSNGLYQRIIFNGTRYRGDDLIALYLSGKWPTRSRNTKSPEQKIYENHWMSEVKSHSKFPDWSGVWAKEKARIKAKKRWDSMSPEERYQYEKGKNRCPIKKAASRKRWKLSNPDKVRDQQREWNSSNQDKIRQFRRKQRALPHNRAKLNLRKRFKDLMKTVKKGGSQSFSRLIGCSTNQLAKHLESQFKKGMDWMNYGSHWHIDHIIPVAAFDHTKPDQVKRCWHWTNLRPLEAEENMKKSDRITHPQLSLCI